MKKLSFINKLIFAINNVFAIILLLTYFLPFIQPKTLPKISLLSLTIPVLIFVNVAFLLYWLIRFKKQFLVSAIILFIGFFLSTPFYILKKNRSTSSNEVSIMNYNVRLFNAYNSVNDKEIPKKIKAFIQNENPDVLCIQEYYSSQENLIEYPYKYIKTRGSKNKFGQAIYSKYKIVNQGSIDFNNTLNNAIFVDIVKANDTLRIYNLHLESLGLNPNKENFGQKNSEKLIARLSKEFIKQEKQVEQLNQHKNNCKYTKIISGDFNNTAYSWTYKNIKNNMKDSFLEAGSGFGKTFEIKHFPMRIDFIFVDEILNINEHKNYNINYSDHFPILARIGL